MTDHMSPEEYCEMVERKSAMLRKLSHSIPIHEDNSLLVSLKKSNFNLILEPSIIKDYGYFVRSQVYDKIGRISKRLDKLNKRLIIRSAWRSFAHQWKIRENYARFLRRRYPERQPKQIQKMASQFIAPVTKSTHTTGGAVDALLFDLKTNSVMDFGTNKGLRIDLSEKCYTYHPNISAIAKKNRLLLITLFQAEGFVVDLKEYWHFDYGNITWAAEKYKKYAKYGVIKSFDDSD